MNLSITDRQTDRLMWGKKHTFQGEEAMMEKILIFYFLWNNSVYIGLNVSSLLYNKAYNIHTYIIVVHIVHISIYNESKINNFIYIYDTIHIDTDKCVNIMILTNLLLLAVDMMKMPKSGCE